MDWVWILSGAIALLACIVAIGFALKYRWRRLETTTIRVADAYGIDPGDILKIEKGDCFVVLSVDRGTNTVTVGKPTKDGE